MTQREAAAASQRHTASNEVRSLEARLRDLQTTFTSQESDTAELQRLRGTIKSSEETVNGIQREFVILSKQMTGSLDGVRALQKDIEQQLAQVQWSCHLSAVWNAVVLE